MTQLSSLSYTPTELTFGTSGLRGLVSDMTDLECYINAAGFIEFAHLAPGSTISIAGDLRTSTPRILAAVTQAVVDLGHIPEYAGLVPTPALAHWALSHRQLAIMVTGSHIPDDRNGIKFYTPEGEILKSDEAPIAAAVASVRDRIYQRQTELQFGPDGMLRHATQLPDSIESTVLHAFDQRLDTILSPDFLRDSHIVVYQHSAVGRDYLVSLLERFGARVSAVGRSNDFVSIDTENVTPDDLHYFEEVARAHPGCTAIVSTDGDSDRPFVIDEDGVFYRGDIVGAIVAQSLGAEFGAIPISSNDAVDGWLNSHNIAYQHTKIGSPYVIESMQHAQKNNDVVVGWEVNGGFLVGSDIPTQRGVLSQLATRDAFLPIMIVLQETIRQHKKLSELFEPLAHRHTDAGLIDNFAQEKSRSIITALARDDTTTRQLVEQVFDAQNGFGRLRQMSDLDGIRLWFDNGDIVHIRPSGNAPQLRAYSVADSQSRAEEIVRLCIRSDGILDRLASIVSELGDD